MSNGCSSGNKVASDLGKRLLEAARLGHTDEVSSLMTSGAPLTTDWLGTTPLHLASIYGHTATAEILIKSGISKDGRTKVDKVPLHFACQHGHFDVVKLLVNSGAHMDAMDMLNMTPLHWAVEAESFEICLFLLKVGVKTDIKNKEKGTSQDADVKNQFDKTALDIATSKHYDAIEKLLSDKKFLVLQELDVLQPNELRKKSGTSVKICKDMCLPNALMYKKQKTRRFPMVAGTWTGGEAQTQERFEISERKRLGVYKRRQYQQRDLLANSLLQNLQSAKISTTTSATSPKTCGDMKNYVKDEPLYTSCSATKYSKDSPLVKLEETVRLSTGLTVKANDTENNLNTVNADDDVNDDDEDDEDDDDEEETSSLHNRNVSVKVLPSLLVLSLPDKSVEIPFMTPNTGSSSSNNGNSSNQSITTSIPTISDDGFETLPDNIQAIPLDITIEEFQDQQNKIFIEKNNKKVNEENTVPGVFDMSSREDMSKTPGGQWARTNTTPVHLPANLLHQISDGNVILHTLNNKTVNDGCIEKLAGIRTEMGIIPLVPVSDEGGLTLIPVENSLTDETPPDSPQDKKDDNSGDAKTPTPFKVSPMIRPVMFPHPVTPDMIASHQQRAENSHYQNRASFVLPPGVILHPSQSAVYPVAAAGHHPEMFPRHGQIHPASFFPPPMHHPSLGSGSHHPFMHPSLQPIFHMNPTPVPQYIYVDGNGSSIVPSQIPHLAYGSVLSSTTTQDNSQDVSS